MAGNSLGSLFKVTTFGESHGKAVGVLIDGVRPNLPISETEMCDEMIGLERILSAFNAPLPRWALTMYNNYMPCIMVGEDPQ